MQRASPASSTSPPPTSPAPAANLHPTTPDIAGAGTIDITTGSNDTSITAGTLLPGGTADDIVVHAAALADGKTLTLAGPTDFTVDHLVGDLHAAGLAGKLDVTTTDIAGPRRKPPPHHPRHRRHRHDRHHRRVERHQHHRRRSAAGRHGR